MNHASECLGYHQTAFTRRHLLQVGGVGLLGLGLPGLLQAAEGAKKNKSRAKAVIFLHQFGGPSHVDTFDMKPNAPEAIPKNKQKTIAIRLPVIPSEVEGSRGNTVGFLDGIPRLRFAALGMTAKEFILGSQSAPVHRAGFPGRFFPGRCAFRCIATRRFARIDGEAGRTN